MGYFGAYLNSWQLLAKIGLAIFVIHGVVSGFNILLAIYLFYLVCLVASAGIVSKWMEINRDRYEHMEE